MQSGFLEYHNSVIHYRYGGTGSQPLLCFHGYGEKATHFDFLEKKLGSSHFIIAIDLPFHGDTKWNELHLDGQILTQVIKKLLYQFQVNNHKVQLLGFSLGGRIALCVLEQMAASISKLVLLAPDGLTVNFWYWLSTQTSVGNRMFRLTMAKPGWFLGMLRLSNRARIINQSIYKFVEYYIHDTAVRKELYDRWTGLRKCTPDLKKIKKLITQHHISVQLLYGKFDRIIGQKKGHNFLSGMQKGHLQVLHCGHQLLHEKNAEAIAQALLH